MIFCMSRWNELLLRYFHSMSYSIKAFSTLMPLNMYFCFSKGFSSSLGVESTSHLRPKGFLHLPHIFGSSRIIFAKDFDLRHTKAMPKLSLCRPSWCFCWSSFLVFSAVNYSCISASFSLSLKETSFCLAAVVFYILKQERHDRDNLFLMIECWMRSVWCKSSRSFSRVWLR